MTRFGLLHHPKIPESAHLAHETETALAALGAEAWCASAWDEPEVFQKTRECDMLITFGGDGTIVRTARNTAGYNLPLLGVNLGRLGFLAEVQPWELHDKLPALVNGKYWLEERLMLRVELKRAQRTIQTIDALNDVVVTRGRVVRVVRIDAHIDGQYLTTFAGDGVIVATPTGSTAYSLSAGGPILAPQMTNLLLTPIAPHVTVTRSLVLPANSQVHLDLSTEYEATLTVDGQVDVPLNDGDSILISASPHQCHFVRLGDKGYFFRTLLEKLR